MTHDPIEQLLRRADATAGAPQQSPDDLPARVKVLHTRRQRRRLISAAASAALLCIVAVGVGLLSQPSAMSPGDIARLKAEITELREQITEREAHIELLLAIEQQQQELAQLRQVVYVVDPTDQINYQVSRAALTILLEADRKHEQYGLTESARRDYQRIIDLFPDTDSAATAHQRLAALNG